MLGVLVPRAPKPEPLPVTVIESPAGESSTAKPLPAPQPRPRHENTPKKRAVFGLSRKAITSEQGEEVKAGNTTAKAPDQEKLRPGDEDALPIPADEYLVTQMPVLKLEVRVPYPEEAKKRGVQGAVTLDLLIDGSGTVREVQLVQGPGFGLNEAAITAARQFRFEPARMDNQTVAVRIRYVYRFVLER